MVGATEQEEVQVRDAEVYATPVLMAVKGGWMALSATGSRLRIGVIGESKEQALLKFEKELRVWIELLNRSELAA